MYNIVIIIIQIVFNQLINIIFTVIKIRYWVEIRCWARQTWCCWWIIAVDIVWYIFMLIRLKLMIFIIDTLTLKTMICWITRAVTDLEICINVRKFLNMTIMTMKCVLADWLIIWNFFQTVRALTQKHYRWKTVQNAILKNISEILSMNEMYRWQEQ